MSKKEKFGSELALGVLEYLRKHGSIGHNHYGYCGVGLVLVDGSIHYTHFDEWLTYQHGARYQPGGEYQGIIQTFTTGSEFVDWLSEQTDDSMSGKETNDKWYTGNQRITRCRLQSLLGGSNA